jgi:hypothetical protein
VLLPLAVLGLLGAGFGAYAVGQGPAPYEPQPVGSGPTPTGAGDTGAGDTGAADTGAAETTPAPEPEPEPEPLPAPLPEEPLEPELEDEISPTMAALEEELEEQRAVVVAFYMPSAGLDGTVLREARAGASLARAGFISVNVAREGQVSELATEYAVIEAPAVLVFLRGPRVAKRFDRYVDRETVAQAVANSLR